MSLIWVSHVPHMSESCPSYEWVMSLIWVSHVPHMSESCPSYKWVMSRISMGADFWKSLTMWKVLRVSRRLFRKRANNYRALLRKMTNTDKTPEFWESLTIGKSVACITSCFFFLKSDILETQRSLICGTWRITCMRNLSCVYVARRVSFPWSQKFSKVSARWYAGHDSFTCTRDMTHSHICGKWLIHAYARHELLVSSVFCPSSQKFSKITANWCAFFAKEPLIIRLFCGKWPMKIRRPTALRHPLLNVKW